MAKPPTPNTIAASLTVPERVLLFCLASDTDWFKASVYPDDSKYCTIASALLTSLFRGINIDKLAESVRSRQAGYRTISETEELFVKILKGVKIVFSRSGFSFSPADVYDSALEGAQNAISIIEYESEFHTRRVKVPFSEVRRSLRTDHDRQRFEVWINEKKGRNDAYVF